MLLQTGKKIKKYYVCSPTSELLEFFNSWGKGEENYSTFKKPVYLIKDV